MQHSIYQGKKVLVTGSTGFKGSWLCIWLKMLGAEVYGYALNPVSKQDNFVCCGLEKEIHQRYADIRDLGSLKKFFAEVKPDMAFHLAAQALVLESYQNPHYTFETNLIGTVNFFEAIRSTPSVKLAVNITSDKCYQNNEWVWGYRENDPMGGKDPYSASKGCAELIYQSYLYSYFRQDPGAAVASARAGNVIGGGDWAKDRIVPDFFRAYFKNESLEIRKPMAVRPWQHVLEPLNGYLQLGEALYTKGRDFSGGWNFGPTESNHHTVRELIEGFIRLSGKGAYHSPEQQQYPHEAHLLKLDISKATTVLGWKPILNFEQTLSFTLNGYLDEAEGRDVFAKRRAQIKEFEEKASLL